MIEKTCKQCGKTFNVFPSGNHIKFCSTGCAAKGIIRKKGKNHYNWKGWQTKKICELCKKPFFVINRRKHARFCSLKCYRKIYHGITKICEWCGKEFYVHGARKEAKFCSKECHLSMQKKYTFVKECERCGKPFKEHFTDGLDNHYCYGRANYGLLQHLIIFLTADDIMFPLVPKFKHKEWD